MSQEFTYLHDLHRKLWRHSQDRDEQKRKIYTAVLGPNGYTGRVDQYYIFQDEPSINGNNLKVEDMCGNVLVDGIPFDLIKRGYIKVKTNPDDDDGWWIYNRISSEQGGGKKTRRRKGDKKRKTRKRKKKRTRKRKKKRKKTRRKKRKGGSF